MATTTNSESGVLIESTNMILVRNENALFSNISDFENDDTPDAAETDDDSDAAEELMAEEYHPYPPLNNYYSGADICEDIVIMVVDNKNRPKKTVRFTMPPVEEKRQPQVIILRGRQRQVTIHKEAKSQECGFLDWIPANSLWILDIMLCV
jgi:hypothetical protein